MQTEYRRTDTQTDLLITILRSLTGAEKQKVTKQKKTVTILTWRSAEMGVEMSVAQVREVKDSTTTAGR